MLHFLLPMAFDRREIKDWITTYLLFTCACTCIHCVLSSTLVYATRPRCTTSVPVHYPANAGRPTDCKWISE